MSMAVIINLIVGIPFLILMGLKIKKSYYDCENNKDNKEVYDSFIAIYSGKFTGTVLILIGLILYSIFISFFEDWWLEFIVFNESSLSEITSSISGITGIDIEISSKKNELVNIGTFCGGTFIILSSLILLKLIHDRSIYKEMGNSWRDEKNSLTDRKSVV